MERTVFREEHDLFRDQFRRFATKEIEPKIAEWNQRGMPDRETWRRMDAEGFLGANQPEECGGAGGDFLYDAIITEKLSWLRAHALTMEYVKQRKAFGQPLAAFQNTQFQLAELASATEIGQVFVDRLLASQVAGDHEADHRAASGARLRGLYGFLSDGIATRRPLNVVFVGE